MQAQRITLLALLALLAGATLAAASTEKNDAASTDKNDAASTDKNDAASTDKNVWTNKFLQNWDNGWDVNIFGEPLDVNIACDYKPCIRHRLTKPEIPLTRDNDFCTSSTGEIIRCIYLPEGAILVNDLEFGPYDKDDVKCDVNDPQDTDDTSWCGTVAEERVA
ncbi:hypothetical protein EDD21DRAFT_378724 [Dissophora ornata]|nr:hypothetical protein EDD21DRAFT_378724 [Dissophora ornata]